MTKEYFFYFSWETVSIQVLSSGITLDGEQDQKMDLPNRTSDGPVKHAYIGTTLQMS